MEQILKAIEALSAKIDTMLSNSPQVDRYSSVDIKDLASALAKAQGEYKFLGKDATVNWGDSANRKYDYAPLHAILKAIREPFSKNGLSVTQQLRTNDSGAITLHTIIMHATGQWIESRIRIIPLKADIQTFGSTITYNKRYALMALLGIADSNDPDDDDGESVMEDVRQTEASGADITDVYKSKEQSYEPITKDQLKELEFELRQLPIEVTERLLRDLKLRVLADFPKSKYFQALDWVKNNKTARMPK